MKTLALNQGTTVQALIGQALNNLLEPHGLGRPASEVVLPRGGAAQRVHATTKDGTSNADNNDQAPSNRQEPGEPAS